MFTFAPHDPGNSLFGAQGSEQSQPTTLIRKGGCLQTCQVSLGWGLLGRSAMNMRKPADHQLAVRERGQRQAAWSGSLSQHVLALDTDWAAMFDSCFV